MNDLLFYTLLISLLYYFFIYLPQQKKQTLPNPPITSESAELTEALTTLLHNLQTLNQTI